MPEAEQTSRGFDAPEGLIEELGHREDCFIIVRLTRHELRQVRVGGPDRRHSMTILGRDDGTYDGIAARRQPPIHFGRLDSFPPYVGGDDDDISEWQAICDCGEWKGRRTPHVTVAQGELVEHLNSVLSPIPEGVRG